VGVIWWQWLSRCLVWVCLGWGVVGGWVVLCLLVGSFKRLVCCGCVGGRVGVICVCRFKVAVRWAY